jgi:hypothetical protein
MPMAGQVSRVCTLVGGKSSQNIVPGGRRARRCGLRRRRADRCRPGRLADRPASRLPMNWAVHQFRRGRLAIEGPSETTSNLRNRHQIVAPSVDATMAPYQEQSSVGRLDAPLSGQAVGSFPTCQTGCRGSRQPTLLSAVTARSNAHAQLRDRPRLLAKRRTSQLATPDRFRLTMVIQSVEN